MSCIGFQSEPIRTFPAGELQALALVVMQRCVENMDMECIMGRGKAFAYSVGHSDQWLFQKKKRKKSSMERDWPTRFRTAQPGTVHQAQGEIPEWNWNVYNAPSPLLYGLGLASSLLLPRPWEREAWAVTRSFHFPNPAKSNKKSLMPFTALFYCHDLPSIRFPIQSLRLRREVWQMKLVKVRLNILSGRQPCGWWLCGNAISC